MTIFKCKMCGGTLEFTPGDTVAVCDSCGTKQTLPKLDDDRRANLYDRANHFRRNNEYDKAMGIYEQILAEDNTDAEAYWSLVLCRYGIEYVEDPSTHRRMPTVNRAQFTSVFDDDNYESALHYADTAQKEVYASEAEAINEIQKGILAISQKEQPFDVFICYKETDANGRRTQDSVLANDLYHQLTQEGFKVFFARITLEDKLGTAYEPYIFAALNSAKVMVVLGTKPEHFNAVWVKNEWSRYLALVKNSGGKKMLIPAYKDMDPYDLPEEFSHLQAQDMSKLGFMQDLIRGIKKIISTGTLQNTVKDPAVVNSGNTAVEPLLRRVFMFLEDGNWKEADDYCEKVLDQDPENAQAYLGKLMAELHVRKQEELYDYAEPFDGSGNYQKIIRFGEESLLCVLKKYITHIEERNKIASQSAIYNDATEKMHLGTEESCKAAAKLFQSISGFKDADALAEKCIEQEECKRKERIEKIYINGCARLEKNSLIYIEEGIQILESIAGWKDTDEQIRIGRQKIADFKAKQEAARQAEEQRIVAEKALKKRYIVITFLLICACIAAVLMFTMVIIPKLKLNKAIKLLNSGDYDSAYAIFEEFGDNEAITSSKYNRAAQYIDSGDYDSAYALFREVGDNEAIISSEYDRAIKCIDSGDYESAYRLLSGMTYKDSKNKLQTIKPKYQQIMLAKADVGDVVCFGAYQQDNDISNGKEDIEWLVLAKEDDKILVISDKALDCRAYNTMPATHVRWENCSLRRWINDTFFNVAFSIEEQNQIQDTKVSADKNPRYSTDPGNDTTDKIFLLSSSEAEKYFSSKRARQCKPTAYALDYGVYIGGDGNCWWWLRSPGVDENYASVDQSCAAFVNYSGSIFYNGFVDHAFFVRPALWIKLDS